MKSSKSNGKLIMKKKIVHLLFLIIITVLAEMQSVPGQNVTGFLNSGGTSMTDGQMILPGSIGQAATGIQTDSTYILQGGFWSEKNLVVTAVSSETTSGIPTRYKLYQNFPNPFNPTTMIRYSIPEETNVRLDVYNLLGQLVSTLVDKQQKAGFYTVRFNTNGLSSGIYLYRLQAEEHILVKKMVFLK